MITQEILKSIVTYDRRTGEFLRKNGEKFGWERKNKYKCCKINGIYYYQHRLVFLYELGRFPDNYIDHINGDPSDNRFENLRIVSQSKNLQNQNKPHIDNKSGFLGVHWRKKSKKWVAQISKNGVRKTLGEFNTAEDASKKYLEEKIKFHDGYVNATEK